MNIFTPSRIACGLLLLVAACFAAPLLAQGRGGRGGPPPAVGKTGAPIDMTGYWTAVITEDWHERMLTAPKGDFGTGAPGRVAVPGGGVVGRGPNPSALGNIPYSVTGARLALQWDPAKDEAEGNQCKAYGAPGIMRLPTHLHITWQDDTTLKMEADFGNQTRLFHFVPPAMAGQPAAKMTAPPGEQPSFPGYSVAQWSQIMGGREGWPRGGNLKVVTTNLKAGYYWKNGMPYSGNAVLTEHFRVQKLPDNTEWLVFSQMVEDPEYLTQPYIVNYHFKKLADGSKWKPTPCSAS